MPSDGWVLDPLGPPADRAVGLDRHALVLGHDGRNGGLDRATRVWGNDLVVQDAGLGRDHTLDRDDLGFYDIRF